jgi:hypothetical protein
VKHVCHYLKWTLLMDADGVASKAMDTLYRFKVERAANPGVDVFSYTFRDWVKDSKL